MADVCLIQPNPDLYGLGIRLGFHLSWAISILASLLGLSESELATFDNTLVLETATFAAIAFLSCASTAQAHPIEIVILLFLNTGNIWIAKPNVVSPDAITGWRFMISSSVQLGMALYGMWFWTAGVSSDVFIGDKRTCTFDVFLFSRASTESFEAVRIFYIVLGITISLATSSIIFRTLFHCARTMKHGEAWSYIKTHTFSEIFASTFHKTQVQQEKPSNNDAASLYSCESSGTASQDLQGEWTFTLGKWRLDMPKWQFVLFLVRSGLMAFVVTGIELMLRWNSISGIHDVTSVGQLVPLTVGVYGVVKVFFDVLHRRCRPSIGGAVEDTEAQMLPTLPQVNSPTALRTAHASVPSTNATAGRLQQPHLQQQRHYSRLSYG